MPKIITPLKALNSAFYKMPVLQSEIEKLSSNLDIYIKQGKANESEEYHKGLIKDFLANTWYSPDYSVNTNGREDLVIYNGSGTESKPTVIIEAKSPTNVAEMFSINNPNCKAMQECVYYFLQENLRFGNNEVKHIIITDYNDFYIFDAKDFSRFFLAKTNPIVEQFNKFEAKQLSDTKTSYFYEKCAKPAIAKWLENENITITHFSPRDYVDKHGEELVPLYKILSPEHLLNKPFANDSNSLDKNFYAELLHIIGLEEVRDGGKKLIQRKSEKDRNRASLLESAIYQLEDQIGDKQRLFETALHLTITWVNRLLFLKLVESQQLAYQRGNADYRFLTIEKVDSFDELNILFFKVLGKKVEERDRETREKYVHVPYLNSSLFELSEEERLLQIHGIQNKNLALYSKTVLKDDNGRRLTGEIDNLAYFFKFLDAYNFSSEGSGGITQSSKTLINASVLGLIFEKINGYKDGSFYTPGFITEYMAKEVVERAVVQKFNEVKGWKCQSIDDVSDEIDDRTEANQIINSVRICDPAVGSGHFLVSVLNRLLFIKSHLNILMDKEGKRIKNSDWELRLENDEISVLDEDGNPFTYTTNIERQRVQETLFNEKRTIIENCLFGVDINPASVYICRLRLWIELLKNTYYTAESGYTQLETLPNIDINIKCGNSLVSKFPVKVGKSIMKDAENEAKSKDFRKRIKEYREAVAIYKNESNKDNKRKVEQLIASIKSKIRSDVQLDLFDEQLNAKVESEGIYKNSLEWILEFPEVLDDNGRFEGFDAVIGNPPYGISIKDEYRNILVKTKGKVPDYEIYYYFIVLSHMILKNSSVMSYIVPNTWLFNTFAKDWRLNLFSKWKLLSVLDCSQFSIFEEATVRNSIILFEKETKGSHSVTYKNTKDIKTIEELLVQTDMSISKQDIIPMNINWGLAFSLSNQTIKIINKIMGESTPLHSLFPEISQGLIAYDKYKGQDEATIKNRAYHHFEYKEGYKKWLWGEDVRRYETIWNGEEYIDYCSGIANPRKPKFFKGKRLLIREITNPYIFASIVTDEMYNDPSILIVLDSESYPIEVVLAILNSKLATFYHFHHSPKATKGAFPKILIQDINDFPIPSITPEQQQAINDLVDKIIAAKNKKSQADTREWEEEIDFLVYKLYGLSYDEVLVVDPETGITREEYEKTN